MSTSTPRESRLRVDPQTRQSNFFLIRNRGKENLRHHRDRPQSDYRAVHHYFSFNGIPPINCWFSERQFGGTLWEESTRVGLSDYAVTMLSWPELKFWMPISEFNCWPMPFSAWHVGWSDLSRVLILIWKHFIRAVITSLVAAWCQAWRSRKWRHCWVIRMVGC